MDSFLKSTEGFKNTLKLIETINRSTDDYLFIWDIAADTRWFFGDIDEHYDIHKNGSKTNSTQDMLRVIHPSDSAAVLKSLGEIASGKKDTHDMDYRWITKSGQTVWINCHGTVIRDENNEPYLMIGRVSEENLRHLYNPLTALWNKNKLRIDLKERLLSKGFLMLLDIDSLATINLTHGRQYGDMLLKEIAAVCEKLPEVEKAYHTDHNHFVLVTGLNSQEAVCDLFEKIKNTMAEKCTFTASAVPIDKSLFIDETQLIDSLNMTFKKAKEKSSENIEFFTIDDLSKRIASLELLEELKQSVENGFEGFEVHYQPQIKSNNYELFGVEALLRYNSKSRGKVFPDEFIPVLEDSHLIKDVGMFVLETALMQCKKWRSILPNLHVSVNFSALQFEDTLLAEKVIERIKKANLPGDALTVEITESIELHSSTDLLNTFTYLKRHNINFAIDDFGTGYSNLGYLKQMNVDEIKIDRIFVSGIESETYNFRLISNIIEFARANNIRTCCEGVENTKELITLEKLLPDLFQGYFFDRPCTAEQIEKSYIDSNAEAYKNRLMFINKIYEFKERMGVVHFDPQKILRENEIGLWMIRISSLDNHYELHIDETMKYLLGIDTDMSSLECFEYWKNNIQSDYQDTVAQYLDKLRRNECPDPIEFVWEHPLGRVVVRLSGKRLHDTNSAIVLEGIYRHLAKI